MTPPSQVYRLLASLPQALFRRRLYSACPKTFVFPHRIFSNPPPPPRPHPLYPNVSDAGLSGNATQTSSRSRSSSIYWHEVTENKRTLFFLWCLGNDLRSVHKRKVLWPTDESYLSDLEPKDYLKMLLEPTADLFNQLQRSGAMKTPMQSVSLDLDLGETICAATFHLDNFDSDYDMDFNLRSAPLTAPIVVLLPGQMVTSSGSLSPQIHHILSQCLTHSPNVPHIILTNHHSILVFSTPSDDCPTHRFEHISISITHAAQSLRAIATACLHRILPGNLCIATPHPFMEVDESVILPMGPPQDPSQLSLTDDHIFSTCHRNSDFDLATLFRDDTRALQFLRWQAHVQQKFTKLVCQPGDTLLGSANERGDGAVSTRDRPRPTYAFDYSDIPEDTARHLATVHHPSPLVIAELGDPLMRSTSFTAKVQDIIAEGSKWGICTVYRCQITSIDNEAVHKTSETPSLCLKLFDDRFQVLRNAMIEDDEDEEKEELYPRWFDPLLIAEGYALNEACAFEKLQPAQGSIVPWFYGIHKFTLPDGMVLYGILMEYIEGQELWQNHSAPLRLSPDRQINLF